MDGTVTKINNNECTELVQIEYSNFNTIASID